jgi:hypothetical protein
MKYKAAGGVLSGVFAALVISTTVYGHVPSVSDDCDGLDVELSNYETTPGSGLNNRVTVTIDGTAQVFDFDSDFTQSFGWSQTANHTWTVVIDANRNNGNATEFDTSFQGTQTACQETTIPETTTTVAVTTTAPICVDCTPGTQVIIPTTTTTVAGPTTTGTSPASSVATTAVATTTVPVCVPTGVANPNNLPICALPPTGWSPWHTVGIASILVAIGCIFQIVRRRVA